MIKNYFKVAIRNLTKRKAYTLINILRLATGMAVCLLIVLYVQSELGYDRHQEKGKDIYRLVLDRIYPGRVTSNAMARVLERITIKQYNYQTILYDKTLFQNRSKKPGSTEGSFVY